ncbi:MAG: TonB-dependent receptor [Bryobacteraceae bacterium]
MSRIAIAFAIAVSFAASASAQVIKAQILGSVTDTTQAVIAGAAITLTETGTNFKREGQTNESGNYVFVNLDPGTYQVEASMPGFTRAVKTDIDLRPNTTVRVNVELSPGVVSEVVNVSAASAPLLQTDRADTGGKIEQKQLQQMPLLFNRNYQGLLLLIPGVGRPFRPHSVFYNSQDSLSVRVNGQGRQFNNFQIEGIENKIDNGNLTALVPPAEAIQTVDISTSNFDPEFGNAGGAVTNVTLRSGTNDFHGSLFHYHRNENVQAVQPFARFKAPTVYNQFGGTGGGRIVRDKMFIFGDYQGSRDQLGQVNLVTIPSNTFRTGDLSASPTVIYDPATGAANGSGRMPFAGKIIPQNRISPIARRVLDFIEAPNRIPAREGLQNFEKSTVRAKSLNQFDIKYDWVVTDNDRLTVRYSYQKAFVNDPGLYGPNNGIYGGPHGGGFSGTGPARTQSPGINFSKVFSPTFVWESRFGIVRNRNDAINADRGLKTSEEIGIRGANLDEWTSGLSDIRINGYSSPIVGFSPSLPWARSVTSFGFVNNFSKTFANHIVRFGMDIRRERNDLLQTQTFNPRGRFQYEPGQTSDLNDRARGFANAFASFLLDLPNLSGRDLPYIFPARREQNFNWYVQDKWQFSPKLTVDMGLRYEIQLGSRPRLPGGFSNYNYFNNTLELAGLGNNPLRLADTNYNNFGPRLGLAYRFNEATVVRAGYGISFIPRFTAQFNYPINQNNGYPAANAFVPSDVRMSTGFPAFQTVEIPSDGIIKNPPLNSNFNNTPRNQPTGYVQSWNMALQRQLPGNFALDLAYVGNRGVNNQTNFNVNAATVPGTGNAGRPLFQQFRRVGNTNAVIGTNTWYHALQAKFDRRFSRGLMVTTAYTWSKGLNYGEDIAGIAIPISVALNKGHMSDNRTHTFTQSYMYQLPFGKGQRWAQSGAAAWIAGGWEFQGILSLMTGTWFSPSAAGSLLNAPGNSQRPNWIREVSYLGGTGPGQKFFSTSSFANPAQNTLGNAGRNILEGPGIVNLDASLFRNIAVREGIQLTLRIESFNLSNTPHFNNPNGNFASPQFGEINGAAADQRQFQFGLTLRF